jgi:hypothetical protein
MRSHWGRCESKIPTGQDMRATHRPQRRLNHFPEGRFLSRQRHQVSEASLGYGALVEENTVVRSEFQLPSADGFALIGRAASSPAIDGSGGGGPLPRCAAER